jgi:hypothetical protein
LRARFQLDALKLANLSNGKLPPKKNANIGYEVNKQAFDLRVKASLANDNREREVPQGWPVKLEGPLAWTKDTFQDESEYVYQLTEQDKEEILVALAYFKGLQGQPLITPLPAPC